jgi:apoptosis-inducing factor 3
MADNDRRPLPDLTTGVPASSIAPGAMLVGRVADDEVLLVRTETDLFAIGAHCTHYHGNLVDGLIVGDTVRCPLHHACFSVRSGEALRAPAFDPIACWKVERKGDTIFVREKIAAPPSVSRSPIAKTPQPSSIVIVGGGAAGAAAADMVRREGYEGPVTVVSADVDPPVDRPNLSKDYLAGEAQDDWIPLWPVESYAQRRIDLLLQRRVASIDTAARAVVFDDGSRREFGALLIATGADPVRLPLAGARRDQVFYLRSYADSRAIVERAGRAGRVVVVGASFIGLEVAAALRTRQIAVDVVAPDRVPFERTLGAEAGRFVQSLHEAHGVTFHLGQTVASIAERTVTLSGGATIDADFAVIGVGVRPDTKLAEAAGLAVDRGVLVDEHLETNVPGVFAAGDIARWPDPHTGDRIRVEHWVVAERQGQVAARNMLGRRESFDMVPFFWTQQYDVSIRYVGHAEQWDAVHIDGSFDARDCSITYVRDGRRLAVATIGRDRDSLTAEVELEQPSRRTAC